MIVQGWSAIDQLAELPTPVEEESGFVSIIVAIVLMVILSLVTIGFAQLMQREQRQALDRQLSTQAFYAAESGINDAVQAIHDGFTASKPDCDVTAAPAHNNGIIDPSHPEVQYTCLIIDQSPSTLEYKSISTSSSKVIAVVSQSVNIGSVTISWQDSDPTNVNYGGNCTPPFALPTKPNWPNTRPGMLRLDLIPAGGTLDRQSLIDDTLNLFLLPTSCGNPSTTFAANSATDEKGQVIPVRCTNAGTPRQCNLKIDGLTGAPGTAPNIKQYYVRVRSIYHDSDLTITAADASNNPLKLVGNQVVVDATGRASDVTRRMQVRVPVAVDYDLPEFAIHSVDTICKRIRVSPVTATQDCSGVLEAGSSSGGGPGPGPSPSPGPGPVPSITVNGCTELKSAASANGLLFYDFRNFPTPSPNTWTVKTTARNRTKGTPVFPLPIPLAINSYHYWAIAQDRRPNPGVQNQSLHYMLMSGTNEIDRTGNTTDIADTTNISQTLEGTIILTSNADGILDEHSPGIVGTTDDSVDAGCLALFPLT